MPDMERIVDKLRVDMTVAGCRAKGKNSDFWDGYRKGKSRARAEVAVIVAVVYFSIAAIGAFFPHGEI